jgi:hypothetical protein
LRAGELRVALEMVEEWVPKGVLNKTRRILQQDPGSQTGGPYEPSTKAAVRSAIEAASEKMLAIRSAYEQGHRKDDSRDPNTDGWVNGLVEDFVPTEGEGSQVPFPRDNQGQAVEPPNLGIETIPGYEWHDKSKAFHSVMEKMARDEWAGVDTRSLASRVRSWWDDLEALIKEYWSLSSDLKIARTKNKIVFRVDHLGPMTVEIVGPPGNLKVYVGGASKNFDAETSLFDILMWIEGVPRNRAFMASDKSASMQSELRWAADEIDRANEVLHDVVMTLDGRRGGDEAISDVYGEAAAVTHDLSHNVSKSLANASSKLRRLA